MHFPNSKSMTLYQIKTSVSRQIYFLLILFSVVLSAELCISEILRVHFHTITYGVAQKIKAFGQI